jgi:hypothetical protein
MSRHSTIVDLFDVIDDADELDIDLFVDALGLGAGRADRRAGTARSTPRR